MDAKRWIIFALVCVAALGALIWFNRKESVDISGIDKSSVIAQGAIQDRVSGDPDSDIVLIEYADFQCPGCASLHQTLKTVKQDYLDKIAFVYRHFPLTSIHPNALAAAAAAEAAGQQDKFYEMHDLLFENQSAWENLSASARTDKFVEYAEQLQLDTERFRSDMTSDDVKQKIARDRALGDAVGVNSTPTLFLGDQEIDSDIWRDETKLRKYLDEALNQ